MPILQEGTWRLRKTNIDWPRVIGCPAGVCTEQSGSRTLPLFPICALSLVPALRQYFCFVLF